jgi:hypothetical protein
MSVTLQPGMKVKDLPEDMRCAFQHFPGSQPNVGFRSGRFWRILCIGWKQFWSPIPWNTVLVIADDWGVEATLPHSAQTASLLDIAELMTGGRAKSELDCAERSRAELIARRLVWC